MKVVVTTSPKDVRLRRQVSLCCCQKNRLEICDGRTEDVLLTVYNPEVTFRLTHLGTELEVSGQFGPMLKDCTFVFA